MLLRLEKAKNQQSEYHNPTIYKKKQQIKKKPCNLNIKLIWHVFYRRYTMFSK